MPALDFTESGSKDVLGLLEISPLVPRDQIKCEIGNNTSYLDSRGKWISSSEISDMLYIIKGGQSNGGIKRFLTLKWEGVKDVYSGLLIKLDISCQSFTDTERDCFVFKTRGIRQLKAPLPVNSTPTPTVTSPTTTEGILNFVSTTFTKELPTSVIIHSTQLAASTEKNRINNSNTYSVSMPVIIGVSAGVVLVIIIIIIIAICLVRHKRRYPEEKPSMVNTEVPKVHFTAQARFSLIQEAAPEVDDEDYTSLKESRESYDPYCSLKKDDVDMNVIDTILKGAVSMESMSRASEPRYSCRLTKDDAIIIESARPHSLRQPQYHVLEVSLNVNITC